MRDLFGLLALLFDDVGQTKQLLRSAGLDPAKIDLSGSPVLYWSKVLDEARKRKQVENVVKAATEIYPERESDLKEGMRHYLEWGKVTGLDRQEISTSSVTGQAPESSQQGRLKVRFSSTANYLLEHRGQLIEACQRVGVLPLPGEDIYGADATQKVVRMVKEADIYIILIAGRYGFIPPDSDISVTELEYNCTVDFRVPCLVFVMGEEHPIKLGEVDTGPGAEKLAALKTRIGSGMTGYFKSAEDLRTQVIRSLESLLERLLKSKSEKTATARLHPISAIPQRPAPYIAHEYMLLQTTSLIGRRLELTTLTDWVTGQRDFADVALLAVVAIGGMGKSALTWHWFQRIVEQEWPSGRYGNLQGRLWWSFYDVDANYSAFLSCALAYVSGRPEAEIRREIPSMQEQADLLIRELDQQPFLLVLDGLERILLAYSGANAAHLIDDESLDDETANPINERSGELTGDRYIGATRHPQRRTIDPRAGLFLQRLARLRSSRVIVSTRLFPSDLQTSSGQFWPGSAALNLHGLGETDALELWRAFGARGSREQMLPVFNTFNRHPLLIQVLAGVVAEFREAPGDFDAWWKLNSDFCVFELPIVQVRSHILQYAFRGLSEKERQTLNVVAGFRMPTDLPTLRALLITDKRDRKPRKKRRRRNLYMERDGWGVAFSRRDMFVDEEEFYDEWLNGWQEMTEEDLNRPRRHTSEQKEESEAEHEPDERPSQTQKPFRNLCELDASLTALEDRGLLGWDRRHNRYDLHPIVRGVTWTLLEEQTRRDVYEALEVHFSASPTLDDDFDCLEDLTPAIELFNALIGLRRFDDALGTFLERLDEPTRRLSANRQRIEMLERLFPHGVDAPPELFHVEDHSRALNALGSAYLSVGQPGRAAALFRRACDIVNPGDGRADFSCQFARSDAQLQSGQIYLAETSARATLLEARRLSNRHVECMSLCWLGQVLKVRGATQVTETFQLALSIAARKKDKRTKSLLSSLIAEQELLAGSRVEAKRWATRSRNLARNRRDKMVTIRAAYIQGAVALAFLEFSEAERHLDFALSHARDSGAVEEELAILISLAELHWRRSQAERARELLDGIWRPTEVGPFPQFHAEALNLQARIEADAGNTNAACAAATEAYCKAWCDGPPFVCHWPLQQARRILSEFGNPEPALPPFDQSRFERSHEVSIIPPEESASSGTEIL